MATRTAAQRRYLERRAFDAYFENCPSRQLLSLISDKWVVLILSVLERGAARHSELRRTMAGVSQKMLTQTLRSLERDGIVARSVQATVPVTVSYALTDRGRSLVTVIGPLKGWAEEHMAEVLEERERYDAAQRSGDIERRRAR